jgi:hypothetical protein
VARTATILSEAQTNWMVRLVRRLPRRVHQPDPLGDESTRRLAEVRSVLIERLFRPRSEASASNISRAHADGTLRSDVPPHVAIDLLVGPLFYRMFVQHVATPHGDVSAMNRGGSRYAAKTSKAASAAMYDT